jgi:hypothetical protein
VVPVNDDGDGMTVLKLSQPFSSYRSVHVRPKVTEDDNPRSDTVTVPPVLDALVATIDPNLGGSDDTDAVNLTQGN